MRNDNPKVAIHEGRLGKMLIAQQPISAGERIAVFDGQIYEALKCSDLSNKAPLMVRDHAIQFEEHKWIDSNGIARFINHSCEPNCGIKKSTTIVTMRNIDKGEELTFDYDMTENSDWVMICQCASQSCRKIIRGYRSLPDEKKKKYADWISEYLKKN